MRTAIITADLHLKRKAGMWSSRVEIAGDDIWALTQCAQLANEYDTDLFLLGDVLDTVTQMPRPLSAVQTALGSHASSGRLKFLQGQHDMNVGGLERQAPWLSLISGAQHIANTEFDFFGLRAFALDYFPQPFESLAFSKIPAGVEVLFLHGTIDVAMPMAFHFTGDSLKKFKKLRHVFAGDYHQAISLKVGDIDVHYTGSTWQISSDEPREKSVMMVSLDADGRLQMQRIPLLTRPIIKVSELYDVHGDMDLTPLKADVSDLPAELQRPVILVDMPLDPATMEELAGKGHLYTTSGANPDIPTRELMDKYGTLSNEEILGNYVDREKNPEEFKFTLDVIENPTEDAIKRLKDKLGIKTSDVTAAPVSGSTDINLDADPGEEEPA